MQNLFMKISANCSRLLKAVAMPYLLCLVVSSVLCVCVFVFVSLTSAQKVDV